MAAASRPTPGAPIESTWGGQVHDAAVLPLGVVVASAAYTSNTGTVSADLNAVLEGKASMADLSGNAVVIPQAGVWELVCVVVGTGLTGGTYRWDQQVNGANVGGSNLSGTTSATVRGCSIYVATLAAGDLVRVQWASPLGGSGTQTLTLSRMSVRLLGQAWAT